MADIVKRTGEDVPPVARLMEELGNLSTQELRAELARSLGEFARHVLRLAAIVRALEARGEDLSSLRNVSVGYLRKVAWGQMLPEALAAWADRPLLLRAISQLPLPDQQQLIGRPVVQIAERVEGEIVARQADVTELSAEQIWRLFAGGRIRSVSEQTQSLLARAERAGRVNESSTRNASVEGESGVRLDRRRRGVIVRGQFFPASELLEALADLNGNATVPSEAVIQTMTIALTDEELRRVRVRAAEAGISLAVLLRRSLAIAGLI